MMIKLMDRVFAPVAIACHLLLAMVLRLFAERDYRRAAARRADAG
jgi:hypothetical protein